MQFFVEMTSDLREAPQLRWRVQSDSLLSNAVMSTHPGDSSVSVFDVLIERYASLCARTEDMLVRHITVEVENDLKPHLTRYAPPATESEAEYGLADGIKHSWTSGSQTRVSSKRSLPIQLISPSLIAPYRAFPFPASTDGSYRISQTIFNREQCLQDGPSSALSADAILLLRLQIGDRRLRPQ